LFTNNDNPNKDDPVNRNGSKARAKDLLDLGIQLELFNMNKKDRKFDASLYYQVIIVSFRKFCELSTMKSILSFQIRLTNSRSSLPESAGKKPRRDLYCVSFLLLVLEWTLAAECR